MTTEKNEYVVPATASEQYATGLQQHGTQIFKQENAYNIIIPEEYI